MINKVAPFSTDTQNDFGLKDFVPESELDFKAGNRMEEDKKLSKQIGDIVERVLEDTLKGIVGKK